MCNVYQASMARYSKLNSREIALNVVVMHREISEITIHAPMDACIVTP